MRFWFNSCGDKNNLNLPIFSYFSACSNSWYQTQKVQKMQENEDRLDQTPAEYFDLLHGLDSNMG